MKIRAIAFNTFRGLLRNKLIVLFCAIFVCVVLLFMSPLLMFKAMEKANPGTSERMALPMVGLVMSLVSGFGSLLAVWAAADSVWGEMKSGTILAVMARPVRRWEFLLGKYLGVLMLMGIYVLFMLAVSYLLVWIGGARIQSTIWVLLVYPMVRYALYAAISLLMVTVMHPVMALAIVLLVSAGRQAAVFRSFLPEWLRSAMNVILPSTALLSEDRFLTITQEKLKQVPWTDHATALAYGLDWALVFFLLAARSFRRRSLARD
jgi:ABC-type transport system involved in multi-copper enzyme maturation permease subunit